MNAIPHVLNTVLSGGGGTLSVLLFHKVPLQADPLVPNELCAPHFGQILDFLARNTTVVPLLDGMAALQKGKLPRKAVAITFDDGYPEWVSHIAPALRQHSLPATFFVTSEVTTGTVLWHERIVSAVRSLPAQGAQLPYGFAAYAHLSSQALRIHLVEALQERLKYLPLQERLATIQMLEAQATTPLQHPACLSADDVRSLHSMGFDIGAHTVQHPILNEASDADAMAEIAGSKHALESIIKGPVKLFAYPNGRPGLDYQGKHVAMVKAAGYVGAVSSTGGVAHQGTDPFQLPRTTIWGRNEMRMAYHLARNKFAPVQLAPPKSPEVRCLLVASTFAPIHGGSAVVYENLCKHMPAGSIRVLAASQNYLTHQPIPGCTEHDATASYPVDRIPLLRPKMLPPPANALVSLYRLAFQDVPLYLQNLWAAARIVQKHRINVVCVGELVTGSWLGFALRRLFGCKVVIYVHGEEVTTATGGRLHGNRRGMYLRNADKVVAVSGFTCDALTQQMQVAPNALALIQNGVDTSRFTPGPVDEALLDRLGLTGRRIVLTVGRLVPRKGIDMAIRAMRQVVQQVPNAHHLVVGEGDYRPELERIIQQEGLASHVTLLGKTTDAELLACLRSCDVFLMPNRTMPDGDTEGFGLVFREANACGKPVVGGRAGGAVEAVVDGQTGFLVDGHDAQDIAQRVVQLLTNDKLTQTMGAQGLDLALKNNTAAVAERFLQMCDRLLSTH